MVEICLWSVFFFKFFSRLRVICERGDSVNVCGAPIAEGAQLVNTAVIFADVGLAPLGLPKNMSRSPHLNDVADN